MAVINSKNGKIRKSPTTDYANGRGWRLNLRSDNPDFATNATAGHKSRVAGHKDFDGSFNFYQDDSADIEAFVREGDSVTLHLYENATRFWTCPVLIDSIEVNTEIEDGAIVGGTVNFSASAAATAPA